MFGFVFIGASVSSFLLVGRLTCVHTVVQETREQKDKREIDKVVKSV